MSQNEKKKIVQKQAVLIIIIFSILCYTIYTIYHLILKPTNTFIVENGSLSDEQSVQGYIIRDETVLKGENYKNGLVQIKSEGEKVAKGEQVFRYYTSGEEDLKKNIQELDIKIQEAWEKEESNFPTDVKLLEEQIEKKLEEIYHTNNLQKIKEYKKDLNTYITKKAKIVGEKSPAGSYLKSLIEQRSQYENALNSGSEYITSTKSGVVSYRVDGLEETLTPSNFANLNKDMLEGLKLRVGQIISTSEESGKIIDNFCCYIASILENEKINQQGIKEGSQVTIRLSNMEKVKAEIVYISKENEEESLVIFKLRNYVEELINYRKISFDIIWWEVSGWKIPKEAIKEETNDLQYVIRKREGYTDKIYIKILKEGEKYSIITNYDKEDELIEKGVEESYTKNRKKISLYDEIQL